MIFAQKACCSGFFRSSVLDEGKKWGFGYFRRLSLCYLFQMVCRLEFLSKILNYFCPLCEEMPAKPKNHWRDIAMIDSIYTIISYNQGRQTGLKSVGADETFQDFLRLSQTSRLRSKEFIVCSRLRDHKIYGCKCTPCTH